MYLIISILINLSNIKNKRKFNSIFSINKNNIFSWCEKDHGNSKDHPLDWAREQVSKIGGGAYGNILVNFLPKILGNVFKRR